MVEQTSITVLGSLELLEEVREELDVEGINLRDFLNEVRVAAMVRQRMMRVGHADFRVSTTAAFAADHHRRNSGEIGLECDRLQIEHQLHVLCEVKGDP